MASTIGVRAVAPRAPTRARRGSRTSHVLRASERRAQSSDDADESGADGDKLMGRRGTFREAKEDDEATANVKKSVKLDGAFGKPSASKETWSRSSARRAPDYSRRASAEWTAPRSPRTRRIP